MKITGVICEFNPFHNGHEYLFRELRSRGTGLLICVMSGSFVQRGESAVTNKYTRAAMAVECGADIVTELPFPYCASGAEFFAAAGVRILSMLGADSIGFGSECADTAALYSAAETLSAERFTDEYRRLCRAGQGGAAAYFEAYRNLTGENAVWGANDILALEYIKAVRKSGAGLGLEMVGRRGAAYASRKLTEGEFPSASALRTILTSCDGMNAESLTGLTGFMPERTLTLLNKAAENGLAPSRIQNLGRSAITYLRMCDAKATCGIAETGDGLGSRLLGAAARAADYDGLIRLAAAQNHTASRVRRALLYCLTGVTPYDLRRNPSYTLLLAADKAGREYLAGMRGKAGIPIVTKPADAGRISGAERQYELSARSDALWCMTLPRILDSSTLSKMKPYLA